MSDTLIWSKIFLHLIQHGYVFIRRAWLNSAIFLATNLVKNLYIWVFNGLRELLMKGFVLFYYYFFSSFFSSDCLKQISSYCNSVVSRSPASKSKQNSLCYARFCSLTVVFNIIYQEGRFEGYGKINKNIFLTPHKHLQRRQWRKLLAIDTSQVWWDQVDCYYEILKMWVQKISFLFLLFLSFYFKFGLVFRWGRHLFML